MELNRNSFLNTKRDAWVEVNLDNLEHNVSAVKSLLPENTKLLAVIKADAYGHGAVMCSPSMAASGVEYFGVASIDEGIQLRQAKVKTPILVLGTVPVWSFDDAAKNNLTLSIYSDSHIEACKIANKKNGYIINAHVKIDTGMNRIGIAPDKAVEFIKKVQKEPSINLTGVFTHFACAEDTEITKTQIEKFNSITKQIDTTNLLIHTNNSAAILCGLNAGLTNMSRAGIILYGLMPDLPPEYGVPTGLQLKPVMSLKARIANIHTAKPSEGVSYSHKFKTTKETKIATVPLGYADGVSRKLSNKIFAGFEGAKIKQIGNITMDQMMFDVTGTNAKEGDVITLLGQEGDNFFSIDEWAKILDTINYELTCRLKVRLARVYTRD